MFNEKLSLTHKSTGIINYSKLNGHFRLTVEIDQSISNYYYSLIPKYYKINKPRWPAHITVVRPEKEIPFNLKYWGKYQNEKVEFLYDPIIRSGQMYFWLNIWCNRLEDIREELGLPVNSPFTLPPEGFKKCFHCTIANLKL